MGTAEFKTIGNVKQFIEAHTLHAQGLVQGGYVFRDPIPGFLRPFVNSMTGGWPGNNDMAFDFMDPHTKGVVVSQNEKAPLGGFDTWQLIAKPPVMIAGHSQRVSKDDFWHGTMSSDIAAAKIQRPVYEWNRSVAEAIMDLFTAGAYLNSGTLTEAGVFGAKNRNGATVEVAKPTESATVGTTTIAHASHLVRFPDRKGGRFAAGHDHVIADAGAAWTEALGKTARNHIMEHPGAMGVVCYMGKNPAEDVEAVIETVRTNTESGVQFEEVGVAVPNDFGSPPQRIALHDGVEYFYQPDIPDDIAVYLARGTKPITYVTGLIGTDGNPQYPYAWDSSPIMDPETGAVEYGYRGHAAAYITNPVGLYVVDYTV